MQPAAAPPQFTAPMIDTAAKSKVLDSIYAPQTQFIQSQIDQLPQYYNAQKASIEQAKVNAFRDIGDTAQKRGMFFSGFQPAENARYLGEKYLPGLMEVDNQMNRERQGLLGQVVGLNADRGQQMLGYYDKNDDRTYDAAGINYGTNTDWWNTQQDWTRDDRLRNEEWARDDRIRAEENAREDSQFAQQMRASSSSGGGSGYSSSSDAKEWQAQDARIATLQSKMGTDKDVFYNSAQGTGFLSPERYRYYAQTANQLGMTNEEYNKAFRSYANPTHLWDYGL